MKSEQILQPSACLTPADMEAYIRGELDAKAERKVELHITDCPICSDMIEGMEAYGVDEFQPAVEGLTGKRGAKLKEEEPGNNEAGGVEYFLNPEHPPKRKAWNKGNVFFFSIAAAAGLFIAFRMIWMNDHKSMAEIAQDYTVWEQPAVWRGDSEAKDTLELAKEAIAKQEFDQAIQLLQNTNSSEGQYWLGQSWARMDKPKEAMHAFQLSAEGEGRFARLSRFHQGLTSMQLGDLVESRKIFTEISADELHPKHREATDILSEMAP